MKFRLRNLESRETVKIDVVASISVHQFQQVLSASLSPPPPSPSSLRFSLNAKDELHAPSPFSSLLSLGVASGDLLYFSLNPNAFSPPIPAEGLQTLIPPQGSSSPTPIDVQGSSIQDNTVMSQPQSPGHLISRENDARKLDETLHSKDAEMAADESQSVDVDGCPVRDLPEPYFLNDALREELGQEHRSNEKLLILSLHAVLLQSGFVPFDPLTGRVDHLRLSDKWTSISQNSSLSYTLWELLRSNTGGDMTDKCIVLKFQSLSNFVSVYGSVAGDGSGLRNVRLDDRFATAIKHYVLGEGGGTISVDKASGSIFDFWKTVKDELALPLMVNLCEKAGLALPGCFTRLPTELKLKILESLPGVDLARVEMVSKEMKYIVSESGLWKQKFSEEFGEQVGFMTGEHVKWKYMFASMWESKRNRKFALTRLRDYSRPVRPRYPIIRRDPDPFEFPGGGIIGGEYDRLPGMVVPRLVTPPPFAPPFRPRRIFRTNCNLGGHDI